VKIDSDKLALVLTIVISLKFKLIKNRTLNFWTQLRVQSVNIFG